MANSSSSRKNVLKALCLFLHFPPLAMALSSAAAKQLFPYQIEGVKRLVEGKRMLLADEMGLGKTIQCIAALNEFPLKHSKILIICPKSVLGVWEDELEGWLTNYSSLDLRVATTQNFQIPTDGSITLINYDICYKLQTQLQSIHYDFLICDEAHYLKSRTSKRTQAVLGKGTKANQGIQATYLWLLTGTPILNRPVELFPLMKAMDPSNVESFAAYAQRYCNPKEVYRSGGVVLDYSGASNLLELAKRLEPRMIRRYKVDVLTQLPPKFRSCVCLTGSEIATEQERDRLRVLIGSDELNNDANLEDFGSHASSMVEYLGTKTNMDLDDPDNRNRIMGMIATIRKETALSKLQPAVDLLEDVILSQKVVVFCHHRELISRLVETFGDRAVSIIGGMNRESRADAVRRFQQDDKVRIFIGSIQAAGVGITLTAASLVVFLELDWSPAVMSQAEDRCHRVGQSDSVQVQYYVFKGTIDEWIARSLLSKQSNIDQILPEANATAAPTGYIFDFGKYKDMRLEDVPRPYLTFVVKNEVWKTRPKLWKALAQKGLVMEPPRPEVTTVIQKQDGTLTDVAFTFDFGKHKGLQWNETPSNYREWIIKEGVWKSRPELNKALLAAGFVDQTTEQSENNEKPELDHRFPDVPF